MLKGVDIGYLLEKSTALAGFDLSSERGGRHRDVLYDSRAAVQRRCPSTTPIALAASDIYSLTRAKLKSLAQIIHERVPFVKVGLQKTLKPQ